MTRLSNLIAPSFYQAHKDIKRDRYTHYWFKGGRGSTKSSFVSLEIILGMMQDPLANAVAIRKVGLYLYDSVYEQLVWAIDKLGVNHLWHQKKSPMELIYIPTGQRILFRGADKPKKLKSTKVSKGYIKYIWYEEVDEFQGQEEIDVINQSLLRGGETFQVFYSYNPPQSIRSWVNAPQMERKDAIHYHSTYLTVPRVWLGEQFLLEAEHLMVSNYERYKHEYLGVVTGTGGEVFRNLVVREINNTEILGFEKVNRGIDWGYGADPFVYIEDYYDKKTNTLYIFFEYYKPGEKFNSIAEVINKQNPERKIVRADHEPRSNDELKSRGVRVMKAKKGKDSRDHGFLWLQNLDAIVIDPVRCPNATREFSQYELEKDSNGNYRDGYPDGNDHAIDAVRYSLSEQIRGSNFRHSKRSKKG